MPPAPLSRKFLLCAGPGQFSSQFSVLFAGTTRSGDRKLSCELETSYFTSRAGEEQTQPISGQLPATYLLLPRSSCFHSIPSLAASESFKTPKPLAEAGAERVSQEDAHTRHQGELAMPPRTLPFSYWCDGEAPAGGTPPLGAPKGPRCSQPRTQGSGVAQGLSPPRGTSTNLSQQPPPTEAPPRAQKPQQLAAELRSSPQNAAASFRGHGEPARCKPKPLGSAPGVLPLQEALFLQQS